MIIAAAEKTKVVQTRANEKLMYLSSALREEITSYNLSLIHI